MKYTLAVSWSIVGFSSLAVAANSVKFTNRCPYDIWFWTAGPSKDLHANDEDRIMVPRDGGSVIHGMSNTEELGGGVSLKMRDVPYYQVAPAGIIQVEYHLEPSKSAMWYDLSAVDCNINVGPDNPMYCPFVAGGMELTVPETLGNYCPPAYCRDGECINTYIHQGGYEGEPSFKCWAGADLFIETCTDGPGIQTFYGKSPKERFLPPPPASFRPSPDETCGLLNGAITGYTCAGSVFGACCSKWGYCGNTDEHCLAECQNGFGHCGPGIPPSVAGPHPLPRTVTQIITSTAPANTVTSISMSVSIAIVTRTEIQSKTETKTIISTMTRKLSAPTSSVSPYFLTATAWCGSSVTASQSSSISLLSSTSNPSVQTSPATRSTFVTQSCASRSAVTVTVHALAITVTRSPPASQSSSTAFPRSASPSILTVNTPCIASTSKALSTASLKTQYVTVQGPSPTSTFKVPLVQTRTVTGNASGPVVTATVTSPSASQLSNAASPVTQYVTVEVPGPTSTTKVPITKTTTATQFVTQASAIIITSTITETSISTYSVFGQTTTTLPGSTITETSVSTYHVLGRTTTTLPGVVTTTIAPAPPRQTVTRTSISTQPAPQPVTSTQVSVTTELVTLTALTETITQAPETLIRTIRLPADNSTITLLVETSTITLPIETSTITLPVEISTITLPVETSTITLPIETNTITLPIETITLPPTTSTLTLPVETTIVSYTTTTTIEAWSVSTFIYVPTHNEPSTVPTSTPRIFRPPGRRPGVNSAVGWGQRRGPRATATPRKGRRYGASQ